MTGWARSVAGMLLRTRAFWLRLVPMFLGLLLASGTIGAISATQLSAEQQGESSFGGADGYANAGTSVLVGEQVGRLPVLPGVAISEELAAFARFRPPGTDGELFVVEADGASAASRGRYELLSGRWPSRPGESVATLTSGFSPGSYAEPLVGQARFEVVGTFRITYSNRRAALMFAPGTWGSWQVDERDAKVADLHANRTVFFTAGDPQAVCGRLADVRSLAGEGFTCDTIAMQRDASEASLPVRFLMEQGVPSVLVAVLGALLSTSILSRTLRRSFAPLVDLGLPRRSLRGTGYAIVSGAGLVVTVLGVGLGTLASFAMRPWLQDSVDHPLSPPSLSAGAIVCGFAALIGLIGFVRPVANERRIVNHTVSRAAAQRVAAVGSMVLALAVVGAILAPPTLTTVALIIAAFCGGLALYAPVAILALSGAPAPVGRRLAAIRALGANSRGFAIHVGVTTCLVGLVASTLALLTGLLANLNRNSGTGLPAGIAMVNVRDEGKVPLSADVVGRFRSDLRLGEPVDVWRGVDENAKTQDQTPWWTFRSVADARRLLPWIGDDQARTLEASARLATVAPDERPRPDAVALPWAMRWLAEIRIAASPPPGTFSVSAAFAGLSREQDIAASRWASANGVADGYIWTAEVEPEVPLTTITAVSTVAFATLAAIMGAVAVRGEVAAMRGVLAGFHAMGLGARWCRQVIVLISTLAAGLAVIAGLLAAVLGVLASNYVLGGGVLIAGIPWHLVVMVCLGTLLGGAVGGAASSFRFGAQEHNTR